MLAGAVRSSVNSIVTRSAERGFTISGAAQASACCCTNGDPESASSSEIDAEQQNEPDAERDQQASHVVAHPEPDRKTEHRHHEAHGGRGGTDETEPGRPAARERGRRDCQHRRWSNERRKGRGLAGQPGRTPDRLREEDGEFVRIAVGGAQPEEQ